MESWALALLRMAFVFTSATAFTAVRRVVPSAVRGRSGLLPAALATGTRPLPHCWYHGSHGGGHGGSHGHPMGGELSLSRPFGTRIRRRGQAADDAAAAAAPEGAELEAELARAWDVAALRKETDRQAMRQLKKLGKAEVRHRKVSTLACHAMHARKRAGNGNTTIAITVAAPPPP